MGIYRRGKIWWVRFEAAGEEIRRSARTASRTAALAYEHELREEAGRIQRGGRPRATYRIAMERFLLEYLPTLKPLAATRYRSSARMLHSHFQGLYLDEINSRAVKAFITERRKAGKTVEFKDGTIKRRDILGATVRRDLACLGSMLTRAVEWDMIDANPLRGVGKLGLKESPSRIRYLSKDEYAALKSKAHKLLADIITVAVETGLRSEELLSLKREQVDAVRREIRLIETKSGIPRIVPLSDVAAARISAQPVAINSKWVWHVKGARLKTIRAGFVGACRRAGITGVTFHDLRHTFASWAVQGLHEWQSEPMDLYRLSKWLGHRSMRMTERYAHLETADLQKAVNRESAHKPAHKKRTAKQNVA